jgi:general secretion pathway protein E
MEESDWPAAPILPQGLSRAFLRRSLMLPLGQGPDGIWTVAIADPAEAALPALKAALGTVALRVASKPALLSRLEALQTTAAQTHVPVEEDSQDSALDAPVIALLDRLLAQAVEARATDLHFEPGASEMTVRQRVDGMLRVAATLPAATGRALVARLKILAGLNIAERRLAQDGPVRAVIAGRSHDLRLATLPMVDGEGAALRILAGRQNLPTVAGLGLGAGAEAALTAALAQSHGLILITGPTGSGKTTTLAACTAAVNDPSRKIISIEDPVEYHIPGISQVQVNQAIGLGFAAGLRAFMRADPDVLLVGEVRDAETAEVTVQASLTGHLVLTTLHTNSAAGAVVRLAEMGVEPYLLAATLRLSVGQRLVRLLCRHCRVEAAGPLPFPPEIQRLCGHDPATPAAHWLAQGCDHCGRTGYYGRRAIFEVMPLTEALRARVLAGDGTTALHRAALEEGMVPLMADGLRRVLEGLTSVAEVLRVVQDG